MHPFPVSVLPVVDTHHHNASMAYHSADLEMDVRSLERCGPQDRASVPLCNSSGWIPIPYDT
jgi:hypothetical protein